MHLLLLLLLHLLPLLLSYHHVLDVLVVVDQLDMQGASL